LAAALGAAPLTAAHCNDRTREATRALALADSDPAPTV
jgi:hypothetical protein